MVEFFLAKEGIGVRFPLAAPNKTPYRGFCYNLNMENRKIKSRCIILNQEKILLVHNSEHDYYFFPGGSSNNNESPEETLIREINEEFNSNLENIKLIDILRNVGVNQDETISMFSADFLDKELYKQPIIKIADVNMYAKWISLNDIKNNNLKLFPEYNYPKMFEKLY